MGYRHNREDVLDAAVALAKDAGLGQLSFRRTGRRLGIADRTVVYYFPTKTHLVEAVLHRSTQRLVSVLAAAVGPEPRPRPQLLAEAWAALREPEADPWLRLYVETLGLAVRGDEPYASILAELAQSWTSWFACRLLPGPTEDPDDLKDQAAGLLASLDGLLLLHTAVGPDLATRASRGLGVPPA